jgi:hypothetical protein
VLNYETEDELKAFLTEQHRRAISGELGGPGGNPAERISKVITYDQHPADLHPVGVSAESTAAIIEGMKVGEGNFDPNQLVSAIRDEASPVYPVDQGPHESLYKADGTELDLAFLEGGTA